MCHSCRTISLGFTSEVVPEGQHICDIFNNEQERRRTMSKYLEAGLNANEKVLCLVDTMTTEEFTDCMEELGLDLRPKSSELVLDDAVTVYCPKGKFLTSEMLTIVK